MTDNRQPAPIPKGFEEQTVELNGVPIHYVRGGRGAPLVLLHGWPQSWYEWRLVMPQLAERFDVIVPSLRGINVPNPPAASAGYDSRTMATDIRSLVRTLGYDRINLVGHDIGMLVAFAYAVTYPAEVEKLVIAEGVLVGLEPFATQFARNPLSWNFGFNMTFKYPEELIGGRERIFFNHFFDTIAANPAAITDEAREEYARVYAQPGAYQAGLEWYRAFPQDGEFNVSASQTKLDMPVLGLGGEKLLGSIMKPMLDQVANDVTAKIFPDCGHYIPEEQPDAFVEAIVEFMA